MACYNLWRKYVSSKGVKKWVNEGAAPEGACPSCPEQAFPAAGTWDGSMASCSQGAIKKYVSDGNGNFIIGAVIVQYNDPKAIAACNGDYYIGTGPITNYFP